MQRSTDYCSEPPRADIHRPAAAAAAAAASTCRGPSVHLFCRANELEKLVLESVPEAEFAINPEKVTAPAVSLHGAEGLPRVNGH